MLGSSMPAKQSGCAWVVRSPSPPHHRVFFWPQLVLLTGNYMNAGTRNEGTFGFEINYLTKVRGAVSVSLLAPCWACHASVVGQRAFSDVPSDQRGLWSPSNPGWVKFLNSSSGAPNRLNWLKTEQKLRLSRQFDRSVNDFRNETANLQLNPRWPVKQRFPPPSPSPLAHSFALAPIGVRSKFENSANISTRRRETLPSQAKPLQPLLCAW